MFSSQSFVASQAGQAMGSPDAKPAKQEEKMTCLPVTVRLVETSMAAAQKSEDGGILFHGSEPGMLLLVGVVENASQQATGLEFCLNDSTGKISARYYSNEPDAMAGIEAGRYVSVAAQLRTSPAVHLSVTSISLVGSADEISYHMIDVVHSALKIQRAKTGILEPPTPQPRRVATPMQISPEKETAAISMTVHAGAVASPAVASTPVVSPALVKTSQALQGATLRNAVVDFLRQEGEGRDEGVALTVICARMAPAGRSDILSVLGELVSEGDAFNTIDDDHFSVV
jgi:hypothetical protein